MRFLTHVSLENFRLFKEETTFELAPITILTGPNSSGKSTLIKAILLLKSNFEKNKSIEEIDFSIGGHNLNDFKNSLNYDSASKTIYFKFSCYVNELGLNYLKLGYRLDTKDASKGSLNSFNIYSPEGEMILAASKDFDDEIGGNITYKIDIAHFIKNLDHQVLNENIKKEVYDDPNERWVQKYWLNPNDELISGRPNSHESRIYFDALNYIKTHGIIKQTGWTEVEFRHFNQSVVIGLGELGKEVVEWIESQLIDNNAEFKRTDFGRFFYEDFSKLILRRFLQQIIGNFDSVDHFSSIRSESKKYFSRDDSGFLAFLIQYQKESSKFNPEVQSFIQSQLMSFSIGSSIEVVPYKDFIAEIFIIRNGKRILLSDLGYGYTQLLPIIMKIALSAHLSVEEDPLQFYLNDEPNPFVYNEHLFLLEEPESNLHPSFQTKVGDLLAEAWKKFKTRFIVETHSEYLIRKLQYLTATGKLDSLDTSIIYFNQNGSSERDSNPYWSIKILDSGRLSMPFGEGFFDEADKIAYELYRLKLNNN